jgi:hypothetical protein
MEEAFSADFSAVRVHTGPAAHKFASTLQAHALTTGSDIMFGPGAYRPGTPSGDRLLAHELAHVVQQGFGLPRASLDGGPADPLEQAADRAAEAAKPPTEGESHGATVAVGRGGRVPALSHAFAPPMQDGRSLLAQRLTQVVQRPDAGRADADRNYDAASPSPILGRSFEKVVQRRLSAADARRTRRAKALNAADARSLLQASLPFALAHMSGDQVQQMQRVLDAAVVNPEVQKKANDLWRRSVVAQSGSLIVRDPGIVRRAERALEDLVLVAEADKRIRLDSRALLAPDALKATTDNPDEWRYLQAVGQAVAERGIWLRFNPKLVHDSEDPSRWVVDQRSFEVWLSLGPDGDAIPTATGELTREALLGTKAVGAGYYEHVYRGPVQSALDRETNRLLGDIESGIEQHNMIGKIRRTAFPGVVEAADLLGRADYPDPSIWERPHKLVIRAMEMNVGGNVAGSQAFLLAAALLTRNAASLLAGYLQDTGSGAERAVSVLKVARTAGKVAEAGLAITGVYGVVKVASRAGAAAVDAEAEQVISEYTKRSGIGADELKEISYVRQPPGSIGGGVKPGSSSGAGSGWHELY